MARLLGAALLLLAATSVAAAGPRRWIMDNLPPARGSLLGAQAAAFPAARFATQPQDHFDDANKHTWQQAYFVNDTFWDGKGPIFLCVGGEGPPMDGSAVVESLHCNVAVEMLREKKALMFALEHRYYGCHNMSACPVDSFSEPKADLKYLSSHQAIEDVANFVRQMNKAYGADAANQWVTFGGSYPGMLAGWSRLAHPELIHAAVASSAPVHAKLDMFEYMDAVAHSYTVSDNQVGGSVACRDAITRGHGMLAHLLTSSEGVAQAETALGFSKGELATKVNQQNMLGQGAAYFPSQGNDPACTAPACNIAKICSHMTNISIGDEFQRLAALKHIQGAFLQQLDDSQPNFWFYQTCTQFGFYQTCSPGSKCMFLPIIDVKFMAAQCEDYGITIPDIEKNIEATNKHYGGLTPVGPSGTLGSCVVWPNGEVDPWATLSVLESPGAEQPVIWVEGASHHAWTHPSAATDQASVVDARSRIRRQVDDFLGQECSEQVNAIPLQVVV